MEKEKTDVCELTFQQFLFKSKWNKTVILICLISSVIQFSVFKIFYPQVSFIHGDSFAYINAANQNMDINYYMIGYSRFIRLFSVFSRSDLALSIFQYALLQVSITFLLYTIFYFYNIRKLTQITLLIIATYNPLFLHLSNLVSSDCIFAAVSFDWFATLIWIINKPSKKLIIYHSVLIFIAFTFRYNALIYPIISILTFTISNFPLQKKLLGICFGILLCASFITYTTYKYYKLTNYWQYSPFSGWQLANNAMYSYRYIDSSKRTELPSKFKMIDMMVRQYFDSTRDVTLYPQESMMASTIYMWAKDLSLHKYKNIKFALDSIDAFKKWSLMGPFYKEYGIELIKAYPIEFLKFFILPNAKKYYAPPVEFLSLYNSNRKWIPDDARKWFDYKSNSVKTRTKTFRVNYLEFYPILSGTANFILIPILILYVMLDKNRVYNNLNKWLLIGLVTWSLNAAFTIVASSAALRFQTFPLLLTIILVAQILDCLTQIVDLNNTELLNKYN